MALGAAAVTAIVGLSSSSEAAVLDQIDQWSTLLRASVVPSADGSAATGFSPRSIAMAARIAPVLDAAGVADLNLGAYRTDLTPAVESNGLVVLAADPNLMKTLRAQLSSGRFFDVRTGRLPVAVLGQTAAARLGISRVGVRIRIAHEWFVVIGILRPVAAAAEVDSGVLVGFPSARTYLGYGGEYKDLFVRVYPGEAQAVTAVLPLTLSPSAPQDVRVVEAFNLLTLQGATHGTLDTLVLALGAVAFLIGGLGIANTLLISVLERRVEIAMRMALGARRRHIAWQFMFEALLLSLCGGLAGTAGGLVVAVVVASARSWPVSVTIFELAGPATGALVVGFVAGLMPAVRASRLSPSPVLRSV